MSTDSGSGGRRVGHVAYGGLGGHVAVLLALLEASEGEDAQHEVAFYGVEPAREEILAALDRGGHPHIVVRKRSKLDVRGIWQVASWLRRRQLDVVFFHTYHAVPAVWFRRLFSRGRRPRIIVVERHANHLKSRQDWLLSLISSWVADDMVFLTAEHRDALRAGLGRWKGRARATIIPNGVSTSTFQPVAARTNERFVVGMQSRVNAIKDHPTLLRAVAALVPELPIELRIAGDGESRAGLERLARELGIGEHVRFLGTLDQDALVAMMGGLDLYVHATLGETMSTAMLQAMAMGLPVIASRVHGVTNLVEDGRTAVLVPPQDPLALAAAIRALQLDGQERDRLGAAARREVVTEHSNLRMWARYAALIDRVAPTSERAS